MDGTVVELRWLGNVAMVVVIIMIIVVVVFSHGATAKMVPWFGLPGSPHHW